MARLMLSKTFTEAILEAILVDNPRKVLGSQEISGEQVEFRRIIFQTGKGKNESAEKPWRKLKSLSSSRVYSPGETQTNIWFRTFNFMLTESCYNFSFQSVLPTGFERVTLRPFRERKNRLDL